MTEPIRIFVDEKPVAAAPGVTVLDALSASDAELRALLQAGRAYVTDGVGRPIEVTAPIFPGAIYRVVRSARRAPAE